MLLCIEAARTVQRSAARFWRIMEDHWQSQLDFKLLRILHLLLTLRSVSRTADILDQSQPSISASLKRLRDIFSDPLLVRSGPHMVATERGMELLPVVAGIIDAVGSLIDPASRFEPGTSTRHLRIVAANCFNSFLLPWLSQLIFERAPGVTVEYCQMRSDAELRQALEEGEVDIVIGNWPKPPETLRFSPLMTTDIVCMVRPAHPEAHRKALDIRTYLSLSHLSPTPVAHAAFSPIDGRLRELHLKRRIVATVPEYTVAPSILARTDLVFTTGRPFAEHLASSMSFRLLKAPAELGRMAFFMLWHERSHASGCSAWLRRLIREVAARVGSFDGRRPDLDEPRVDGSARRPPITVTV